MELSDELLGARLRRAVRGDRTRLVLLAVGRRLAVEDEVARKVDETGAAAVGVQRHRVAAADDRALHLRPGLAVRRMDDDLWAVSHEDTTDGRLVAHVESKGPAVGRRRREAGREHLEAPLDREPADLGAEVPAAARDENLHRTIVTGPSFTSSTSIRAPKTPRATGAPSAASSAQKRS